MARAARRRHAAFGALEELGQTNAPTVGPNFLKALKVGYAESFSGPRHLLPSLQSLGFAAVARKLEGKAAGVNRDSPDEKKEELWKGIANAYTIEEAKCLYREMNGAIRADDESLVTWGAYIGLLSRGAKDTGVCVRAPPAMLPAQRQKGYRGFGVEPAALERYKKGSSFFWQAFVSTSLDEGASADFALRSAAEAADRIPLLFDIDIPAYDSNFFWCFDLSAVSDFPEEAEILLLPYTSFVVTEEPLVDASGVTRVRLRALTTDFKMSPFVATIWLDPNGFGGQSAELARHAFLAGMPCFRKSEFGENHEKSWGTVVDLKTVPDSTNCLGLFTEPDAALKWMRTQQDTAIPIVFRVVVSGQASKELLEAYFATDLVVPCEVCVYCGNVARWAEFWKSNPKIKVTGDAGDVKEFLTHQAYDFFSHTWKPLDRPTGKIYYGWKAVKGGTVYGDIRDVNSLRGDFQQVGAEFPPPMRPME